MRGKLIIIEGTDCSGKETQAKLLIENCREKGIQIERFSFPNYESPTGKIIGGPYLGRKNISESWFPDGALAVEPKVASLLFAADRKYNIYKIEWLLNNGIHVILDRYVYSNMAHQGCKIEDDDERKNMYQWLDDLEFGLLNLPKPDISIFLHVPTLFVKQLMEERKETRDEHENNFEYLKTAERAYLELSSIYSFKIIDCVNSNELRLKEDIQEEIKKHVEHLL